MPFSETRGLGGYPGRHEVPLPHRHDQRANASKTGNEYPAGKSVTVYYKPGNPEVALLERTKGPYVTLVAVIFFVSVGLFILIFAVLEYQSLVYHQRQLSRCP